MSQTTTILHDSLSSFTQSSEVFENDGTSTTLELMDNTGQTFQETFDADTGFTYDSDLSEFSGGLVRQKDQLTSSKMIFDSYSDATDASYGQGTLTRSLSGATVSGGELDCSGGTPKSCSYDEDNFRNLSTEVKIDILFKPDFNNTPGAVYYLFDMITGVTNQNAIKAYSNAAGTISFDIYDSSTIKKDTLQIIKSDWVQNQQYRVELFVKSGDCRLYLDGNLKDSGSVSFTRTATNPACYLTIGNSPISSTNGRCVFDNVFVGNSVDSYTTGVTHQPYRYMADQIDLPQFSYSGAGSVQGFTAFAGTDSNSPRYTMNGLYWSGAAWVSSSDTYSTANSISDINTNIASLPVSDTLDISIFTDSNSSQMSTSELTTTYTGKYYNTGNPYLTNNSGTRMDGLIGFSDDSSAAGSDAVKHRLDLDGLKYYYNSGWVESDSYAKTNTAAEINTNASSLDLSSGPLVKVDTFLHSDSGATTPSVDSVTLTYDYEISPITLTKCAVAGQVQDGAGVSKSGYTVEVYYKNARHSNVQIQDVVTITTDSQGRWDKELIETATISETVDFVFKNDKGVVIRREKNLIIPNSTTAAFQSLIDARDS